MKIVNRKTKEEKELVYTRGINFLYDDFFGRIFLKFVSTRLCANIVAKYMNSKLSRKRITKVIKEHNIDMSLFQKEDWPSFNAFFLRKKKHLDFDNHSKHFVSPADSKLLVFKLNKDAKFDIKDSVYSLKDIVDKDLTKEYQNGYALIFRLDVGDYHHYHFIDDGTRDDYKFIKGKLHTVQPIAYEKKKVFHKNCREYTTLHTKNFGDIVEVEVGAMLIGKIRNKDIKEFKKGEEKGYFEFGGSTIIMFVKDNVVNIDNDLLFNSTLGKETIVCCGEKIGIKKSC